MLVKTLKFVIPQARFKMLGAGRTDAKVSALEAAFELFLEDGPIPDLSKFLEDCNKNLPPDIKMINIDKVDNNFNIIQHSKSKEYIYLFSFGAKNHPYCAPFMANHIGPLDIDLMRQAAPLFQGVHNFKAYTSRPRTNTQMVRKIDSCKIRDNTVLKANFFPKKSYALHVEGAGFMRYQIRMIMGALIQLGRGELSLEMIKASLEENTEVQITYVAPGSGLLLHRLQFN